MDNLKALLSSVNNKGLREFALDYSQRDKAFARALAVRFTALDFEFEVEKIANMTINAFNGFDDCTEFSSWDSKWN